MLATTAEKTDTLGTTVLSGKREMLVATVGLSKSKKEMDVDETMDPFQTLLATTNDLWGPPPSAWR